MMVREIHEGDDQPLGEIIQTSLKNYNLAIPGTVYFDSNLFKLSEYYKQTGAKYWVLEKEGKVVGGCGIGPYQPEKGIGELQKLYIIEKEQGKGYAHLLMKKSLEFAAEQYQACYIETFASLDKANQLYKQYGFEPLASPLEGSEHGACDTWFLKQFERK